MAAKIYQFQQAGFSFVREHGYNIVPGEIIRKYYSDIVQGCDVDPFVIKYYSRDGEDAFTIDDGIVLPITDAEEDYLHQQGMKAIREILKSHNCDRDKLIERKRKLDIATDQANNDAAFFLHRKTVYQRHTDSGYDIITLKCDNGRISCGWYDHSRTEKLGLQMSAFMLYALGFINAEDEDKQSFWRACHDVLPHSSDINIREADLVIIECLKNLVTRKRSPGYFETSDLW